ncbi:MAG: hypothetical protein JEZ12_01800 [Desulfobacterium sp.]|nr:hypothetical protein [Desulfobacterium sp.]
MVRPIANGTEQREIARGMNRAIASRTFSLVKRVAREIDGLTISMSADFVITDVMVDDIMEKTAQGEKYLPEYQVEILDEGGELVARVTKQLYIRKKKLKSSPGRFFSTGRPESGGATSGRT